MRGPIDMVDSERWLPVVGWVGFYEISDRGRVRSLARRVRHYAGGTRAQYGRIMKQSPKNYPQVDLRRDGTRNVTYVHRMMLLAFVGPCPEGMETRHLDGDPSHNSLDNLRWGSPAEQDADRVRHGTMPRGETHGNAKLTEAQVLEIRHLYAEGGWTHQRLGKRFDVSGGLIPYIVHRKTWRHI